MAEDFHGVKPVSADLKPDQQTLRDRQDVWDDGSTGDALDALLAQTQQDGQTPPPKDDDVATPTPPPKDDDVATPTPPPKDDDVAAPAKNDDLDLPDPSTVKLPDDAGTPPKDDDDIPTKKDDDPYPDLQLSGKVSGKTAEQWAALKSRYATDFRAKEDEISQLKAKLAEVEQKIADPIPEDTKKELEDLRQFRARLDVEADPTFQAQFDQRIATARNFIIAQLGNAGFSKEAIDRVKEVGAENVDWDSLDEKIPAGVKRLIQSRLDEIEVIKYDRQAKLDEAKANIGEYIKKQRESYAQRAQSHGTETDKQLSGFIEKLDFLKQPEPLKASASKDERVIYDAKVKHRQEILESIAEARRDDSPYMRALLIAGMAQLLNLKPNYENLVGAYKSLEAKHAKAMEWIEKVKNAGKPRQRDNAEPTPPAPTVDYTQTAGDALDALRKRMNA